MSDADELVAKIRAIADEVEGTTASVTDKAQAAVGKAEEAVSKFRSLLTSSTQHLSLIHI